MITLFSELPPASKRPSPFLVSVALHVAAFWLVWFGLHHVIRLVPATGHDTVKLLNLDQPLPQPDQPAAAQPLVAPSVGQQASRELPTPSRESPTPSRESPTFGTALNLPARAAFTPAPAGNPGRAAAPAAPQLLTEAGAIQTLLQPTAPRMPLPEQLPIPRVVIWQPKAPHLKLVAPPVQQEASTAELRPSPKPPNDVQRIADLAAAPSPAPATPLLAAAGTTPILLPRAAPLQRVPQSASRHATNPSSAQIVSLSGLQLRKGTVPLPQISEIARGSASSIGGMLRSSVSGSGSAPARKSRASAQGDGEGMPVGSAGNRMGSSDGGGKVRAEGPQANTREGRLGQTVTGASGSLQTRGAVTRIFLPKNGQFGFVVVGGSVPQDDPDAPNVWGGRLVYSVYLHVGLPRNWILQFALPADSQAVLSGNAAQPKAPWPYLMVRPHLDPGDWDADAILVHGFVDANGRFDKLAVVFPTEFAQSKFVIDSLDQWRFRPALEGGRATPVEVLLAIPNPSDDE